MIAIQFKIGDIYKYVVTKKRIVQFVVHRIGSKHNPNDGVLIVSYGNGPLRVMKVDDVIRHLAKHNAIYTGNKYEVPNRTVSTSEENTTEICAT